MIGRRTIAGVCAGLVALAVLGSATASAAVPKGFFGVAPQGPLVSEDYERMGEAKVGILRFEVYWAGLDPTPAVDDYDWYATDTIVGSAARNGVRVLPFVSSAPSWVLALDGHDCEPGKCPPYAPEGKQALAAWKTFLADLVKRYGPNGDFWTLNPTIPKLPIGDWQIWNEQNSPSFFKPKPDVKAYAKLLAAAHDAITAEDPGAEIILGGMFGTPLGGRKPALSAWDYLAKLYKQKGAAKNFDGVAPHPYAAKFSKVLAQIDLIRDEIKAAHDTSAELWITEIGWASGGSRNPLNRGLAGQADRLTEAFTYFLKKRNKLKIRTVNWYSWRDNSATDVALCAWCPKSGLLNEDRSAKPSFEAFTDFTGGG